MSDISKIGYSIRSLRKSKGMTLQQLSEATGLSTGYLSNLERNISSPTLMNIQKICEVFGNSLGDLLERNAESRIVVRKEDREVTIDEENNMRLETIDFGTGNTSYLYMTIEPDSSSDGLWWVHECDEVGTVLSGHLTIMLDEQMFELNVGDTILIKAHTRHCYFNKHEKTPCVSFWARYWDENEEG